MQTTNAMREAVQDLRNLANRDGITTTVTWGDKSATIGPDEPESGKKATLPGFAPKVKRPFDSDFERDQVDYIVSPSMAELGRYLIENKRALRHLKGTSISYLWKAKGGQSGGKLILGKCAKTPPLVKTYQYSTFTIWLAHDHCKEFNLSDAQLEALLYHELCHAVIEEVENEKTGDVSFKPTILAHDLEMFLSEVEEYGLWRADLVQAHSVFQQELPGFDTMPFEAGV